MDHYFKKVLNKMDEHMSKEFTKDESKDNTASKRSNLQKGDSRNLMSIKSSLKNDENNRNQIGTFLDFPNS